MFVLIFNWLNGNVTRSMMMNKLILSIGYGIQSFFKEKMNILIMLLVVIIILLFLNMYLLICTHIESSNDRYHLYANTLNAMGIGFGKKFDLFDGSEANKELTTEQILIREQSKKKRLRDLFR